MDFKFTVLGCAAAAPTKERNPSSFLIKHNKNNFLIDCAEGTQMQMLKFGIKHQKIDHIFISHMHGDHFFGVAGLISTMHLMGRNKDLHLYCPEDLKNVIELQLAVSDSQLRFQIHFHFLNFDNKELLFENSELEVYSFPLQHVIPCCGFLFKEKQHPRKLIKDKLPHYLTIEEINDLLAGRDIYNHKGEVVFKNKDLSEPPPKSRVFAYCSDTKVHDSYRAYIQKADLVYHETTFLDELKDRALSTCHSTALDVGKLASECEINQLIIGHFSARYKNLTNFIAEVQLNHENVVLAEEGRTYNI